jgi:PhoPQ-activated pathogenicity-related protein
MKRFPCAIVLFALAVPVHAQLIEYVNKPDDSYKWEKVAEATTTLGVQCAELRMVSQTWKDVAWKHRLHVAFPKFAGKPTQGILVISGGAWRQRDEAGVPNEEELLKRCDLAAKVAGAARMPVAVISQIPFQPMFDDLREDALIAYTYDKYLKGGDAEWPLLLPMTKAAVRGIDTFQQYAEKTWSLKVTNFVVGGGSKRGWTTWLTAAADKRVNAIAPMVFDTLNFPAQMKHQLASYGKYSEQIDDYSRLGITEQFDTPRGRTLTAMVDPFTYRERFTMPKLIINGSNDRYWVVDSLNLYWNDLVGEKYVLYIPNAGHDLGGDMVRIVSSVTALARKAAGKLTFPKHEWAFAPKADGVDLSIQSEGEPKVYAWVAASETRDFRESTWTSHVIEKNGDAYVHHLARPEKGFAAMFGEAQHNLEGQMLFLSTQVQVIEAAKAPAASQ